MWLTFLHVHAYRPGAFCGLRLLPGKETQEMLPELRRKWAEALVQQPPDCMAWLKLHTQEEKVRAQGVTKGSVHASD